MHEHLHFINHIKQRKLWDVWRNPLSQIYTKYTCTHTRIERERVREDADGWWWWGGLVFVMHIHKDKYKLLKKTHQNNQNISVGPSSDFSIYLFSFVCFSCSLWWSFVIMHYLGEVMEETEADCANKNLKQFPSFLDLEVIVKWFVDLWVWHIYPYSYWRLRVFHLRKNVWNLGNVQNDGTSVLGKDQLVFSLYNIV